MSFLIAIFPPSSFCPSTLHCPSCHQSMSPACLHISFSVVPSSAITADLEPSHHYLFTASLQNHPAWDPAFLHFLFTYFSQTRSNEILLHLAYSYVFPWSTLCMVPVYLSWLISSFPSTHYCILSTLTLEYLHFVISPLGSSFPNLHTTGSFSSLRSQQNYLRKDIQQPFLRLYPHHFATHSHVLFGYYLFRCYFLDTT